MLTARQPFRLGTGAAPATPPARVRAPELGRHHRCSLAGASYRLRAPREIVVRRDPIGDHLDVLPDAAGDVRVGPQPRVELRAGSNWATRRSRSYGRHRPKRAADQQVALGLQLRRVLEMGRARRLRRSGAPGSVPSRATISHCTSVSPMRQHDVARHDSYSSRTYMDMSLPQRSARALCEISSAG